MEQKKQLIIQVLNKLKPYRTLAEGILALVESPYADEKSLDGIIKFTAEGIKNIKAKQQGDRVQKVKKLEQSHHEREVQDVQEAEDLLKTI
ncbi:MAG: hypothetical protein NTX91_03055 [candidate division SR1 bacterium]|nr:hypothetical protein [candidate division SR1 bacterium]